MSEHRRPEIRFSDAPRGSCRWCGGEILHEDGEHAGQVNRRRRWHPTCVDDYNASDPREARRRIRKRDRGTCAACGLDTRKLKREFKAIGRGRKKAIRERGFKPRQSLWELDHIVPLIDGGGHDDDNLQTLCTPCHSEKTAAEARARAERSRVEGDESPGRTRDAEPSIDAAEPEPTVIDQSSERQPSRPRTRRKGTIDDLDSLIADADAANARIDELLDTVRRGSSPTPSEP